MNEKRKTAGLGRGLSDLLGDGASVTEDINELDRVKQHKYVGIDLLAPSPYQPRHTFDEESLNNLVDSIKEKGVLQPLLVRRNPEDNSRYEIIAGERRFRASQIAGLKELPVIVKEMNNQEVLEVALIENIQRQDLNAIEEAEGYNRLIEEFNHTQEELGKIVGKSRSHVANTMRLLMLPSAIKDLVVEGKLTAGHARALITAKNPEEIAEKIVSKGLNVRQVEKLTQSEDKKKEKTSVNIEEKDDDAKALEKELSNILGTKIGMKFKEKGGEITISFDSLELLDILIKRLTSEGSLIGIKSSDNEELEVVEYQPEVEETQELPEEALSEEVLVEEKNQELQAVEENIDENQTAQNTEQQEEYVLNEEQIIEDENHSAEEINIAVKNTEDANEGMSKEEVERLLHEEIANPSFSISAEEIMNVDDNEAPVLEVQESNNNIVNEEDFEKEKQL